MKKKLWSVFISYNFIQLFTFVKHTLEIRLNLFVLVFFLLMVFNATFNNISVISWQSVLLVEETGGPGGNHQPSASH